MYDDSIQLIRGRLDLLNATRNKRVDDGTYNIYRVDGVEELGKPYSYTISFMSHTKLNVEDIVDTDAKVLLQDVKSVDIKKELFGKIYKVSQKASVGDKYLYELILVHPMYYLGLDSRYEVFQEMSAFEVIQTLLTRYSSLLNVDIHTNINPDFFIKRNYTTQYNQSDLEFIQLLCSQEGVTLLMETGSVPFKIRLAHINETYFELEDELRCNYDTSKAFAATHVKDNFYDFKMPMKSYKMSTGTTPLSQTFKDNSHTGRLREALTTATQHDRLDVPRGKNIQGLMEQNAKSIYADTERITGKSQSLYAGIGKGGTLYDTKAIKRTEAILTRVEYHVIMPNALEEYVETVEGIDAYSYHVLFEATPMETIFIPEYDVEKPVIPSTVTALVSDGSTRDGLPGKANTIDIDDLGRIRVIFNFDEKYPTSCYIRFTNFSAGNGWGSQFIPRVNTEVLVSFINGDPDRPIAVGSLYNGDNKIPESVPANKTKSYIKTRSMPGGPNNFNLLLFEDKGGKELVHMQAEKDHLLHVKHDSDNNIDHDERTVVGNDRTEHVKHDEKINIDHDRTEVVGHDEKISIGNDRTEDVGKNEKITIGSNKDSKIGKTYSLNAGDKIELVTGASSFTMHSDGTIVLKGVDISVIGSGEINVKASKNIVMKGRKILEN